LSTAAQNDRLCVVLVATRNPLNIGAAARAMSNFGFRRLRVVNPFEPSFREAKSAVGAATVLKNAEEYKSVAEAVADCTLVVGTTAIRNRELHHPLKRLEEGARLIREKLAAGATKKSGRVAILFGSEKFGLSNDDMSHCHWLINIPTREENISMNLGQAVAVCLYELVRNSAKRAGSSTRHAGASEKIEIAAAADVERITMLLLEAMRESGFLNRRPITDVEARMRRMVRRMKLPARDTEVWLGILRQIVWKMRRGKHLME
jgi:TrmH family RNA methyltransferase